MKKIQLTLEVQATEPIAPEQVREIVQRLINAGLEDATITLSNGEGDLDAAQAAIDLHIGAPKVASIPRCLVVVRGGVADYVNDEGVQVEVFDWDNYSSDPKGTGGVSREFDDLANFCGVPVEGKQ